MSKSAYILFTILDFLFKTYYIFNLIERQHYFNLKSAQISNQSTNQSINWGNGGISLEFLRNFDGHMTEFENENGPFLFTFGTIFFVTSAGILFSILFLALKTQTHSDLNKPHYFKSVLCFLLVSFHTCLDLPILDLITRHLKHAVYNKDNDNVIGDYIIVSLSCINFVIIESYMLRLFNVQVPSKYIPWAQPQSRLPYLNQAIKIILVVGSQVRGIQQSMVILELVVLFGMKTMQAVYRILFIPYYDREIDLLVKCKDLLGCLLLFLGIMCSLLNDTKNFDIVYFLLLIPLFIYGCYHLETFRRHYLLKKIKNKALKLDVENEYAIYLLMTIISGSMNQDMQSEMVFGEMMSLVLTHIEECSDQCCLCTEIDSFYDLLRLKRLNNNTEVIPLVKHEYQQYMNIIDDQSMVGTVSSISEHNMKKSSSEEAAQQQQSNYEFERCALTQLNDRNFQKATKNNDSIQKVSGMISKKSRKKKNNILASTYRVDLDQTKHRYVSEILYFFIYEIQQKYPFSYKIQLLSNYFSLFYKKKEMLCIFQMRSFNNKKLSWFDRCSYIISEKYLLDQITKNGRDQHQLGDQSKDQQFDGEYFIKLNQLQYQFNQCIESLSQMIVSFWRTFEKPHLNVLQTQNDGSQIATDIKRVFQVFNELDTLKLQKDYQMYFQFAIVQLHILNDPASYEMYIAKMKSILDINKVFQKNFTQNQTQNQETQNFIVVDANGKRFGEIIQCNNGLRALLGHSEESMKNLKIDSFMPFLIREKHSQFIKRFNQTGQSFLINKNITVFLKKANGYIIPAESFIKFHYSIDYQYTFLAVFKQYYEMSPFGNEVKYNIDQLLFMIVGNDQEGRITELSESSIEIFREMGIEQGLPEQQDMATTRLFLSDLIKDFNFQSFRQGRQERYLTKQIYENIHTLDMNVFSATSQMIPGNYDLNHNQKISVLANFFLKNGGMIPAKTRIFEERYSGGVLDLNIFCFAFLSQQDLLSISTSHQSNASNARDYQRKGILSSLHNSGKINKTPTYKQTLELVDEDLHVKDHDYEEGSHTASASSSSQGSSSTSSAQFRNFNSFSAQQTPEILLMIIRLIVVLFVIMISAASLNIALTIQKQQQSDVDIETVKNAYDRLNWVSMNQMLLRVQLNIANGYEPNSSYLLENRFSFFQQIQGLRIQALKQTQSIMERTQFIKSEKFKEYEQGKNIPLIGLSPINQQFTMNETLNVAFNLYIAKMTEINSYNMSDFIGKTYAQTLRPNESNSYRPTQYEQALYFASHNGLRPLMRASIDSCDYYSTEAQSHAQENKTTTLVTAIVSICIIFLIGLIIAPIMTKAETRKYKALIYFVKIPKAQLSLLIQNCEYCLNMHEERRYIEIMKDYESFLGIKLIDQSIEKLRQAREKQLNLENQVSREYGTEGLRSSNQEGQQKYLTSQGKQSLGLYHCKTAFAPGSALDSEDDDISSVKKHNSIATSKYQPHQSVPLQKKMSSQGVSSLISQKSIRTQPNKQITQSIKEPVPEQIIEEDDDAGVDQIDNNASTKNQNLKDIKILKASGEAEARDIEENKNKEAQINETASKRRRRMVGAQLAIIMTLSTYFILAYFLSIRTFQTAGQIIQDLEVILYKGACFEQTINFMREKEIRNKSILISSVWGETFGKYDNGQIPATEYFLEFCEEQEETYLGLRKNRPAHLQYAMGYIESLESEQMCALIYTTDKHSRESCENALNGLLKNGLSIAFDYMFQKILKQHLQFVNLGAIFQRTEENMKMIIADETIVEMIDLKAEILNPALSNLKDKVVSSVSQYGKGLIEDYVLAFSIFAILLTLGTLILIFGSIEVLKRSMWDTNVILKILPFETLPKQDRDDIKNFFKS